MEEVREDEEPIDVDQIIAEQSESLVRRNIVVMPDSTRQYAHPRLSIFF